MSIASEITSIGENLKKDYQAIANLGADLTNVDKNIENIAELLDGVYDNLPKTEYQEGTEVNLGKTIKGKLDYDNGVVGIGQSSQDSTQGYNLLQNKYTSSGTQLGITYTKYTDGSMKLNGTATGGNAFMVLDSSLSLPAGTYRLSGCPSGGATNTYRLDILKSGQVLCQDFGGGVNFTLNEESSLQPRIRVQEGVTLNNAIFYPMIISGNTAKPFEKYTNGASPNPSYPQEIKYVRGKNIFNISSAEYFMWLYANGQYGVSTDPNLLSEFIKVQKGQNYVFSGIPSAYSIRVCSYTTQNVSSFKTCLINNLSNVYDFTADADYIRFAIGNADTRTLDKIQLEEGTTSTPYLPYNTIEEVVSGKNYLPNVETQTNVGVTTDYTNAVISINGTSTGSGSISMQEESLQAGTYTMCSKYISGSVNNAVQYIFKKKGASSNIGSFVWNDTNYQNNQKLTFTLDETTIIETSLWIGGASRIYTNFKTNVQLVKGSERDDTYEPYKTPKTYQFSLGDHKFYGIGTYRDYILRTSGKNKASVELEGKYREFNHGTIQTNEDFDGYIVDVQPNTTYISSGVGLSTNRARMSNLCFFNKDMGYISGLAYNGGATTFTTPNNCYYATIAVNKAITNFQAEEGSTASDYQPFGVGNWYKVENIRKISLNGTENWSRSGGTTEQVYVGVISISGAVDHKGLSDYFKQSNYTEANTFDIYNNGANLALRFPTSQITDYSQIKTWLQSHNTDVFVARNTPTYTQITGTLAEQLEEWWNGQSLDGTTIIEGNGDLPMIIKVRGLKGE